MQTIADPKEASGLVGNVPLNVTVIFQPSAARPWTGVEDDWDAEAVSTAVPDLLTALVGRGPTEAAPTD